MLRIDDTRRFNFTIIDNEVIDHYNLSRDALALYLVLARYGYPGQAAKVARSHLQAVLHCTDRTLRRYTNELIDAGLIKLASGKDQGTENTYILLPVSKEQAEGTAERAVGGTAKRTVPGTAKRAVGGTAKRAVPLLQKGQHLEGNHIDIDKEDQQTPAQAAPARSPDPPQELRDLHFETVAFYAFGIRPPGPYDGVRGRVNKILKPLRKTFDPLMDPLDLALAFLWYHAPTPSGRGLEYPADGAKIVRMYNAWVTAGKPDVRPQAVPPIMRHDPDDEDDEVIWPEIVVDHRGYYIGDNSDDHRDA